MRREIAVPGILALSLIAGACPNGNVTPLGPGLGDSIQHNMSLHVIDPQPSYAEDGAPALDGRRAKSVIDRYETGAVIAPESIETTDFLDRTR